MNIPIVLSYVESNCRGSKIAKSRHLYVNCIKDINTLLFSEFYNYIVFDKYLNNENKEYMAENALSSEIVFDEYVNFLKKNYSHLTDDLLRLMIYDVETKQWKENHDIIRKIWFGAFMNVGFDIKYDTIRL